MNTIKECFPIGKFVTDREGLLYINVKTTCHKTLLWAVEMFN